MKKDSGRRIALFADSCAPSISKCCQKVGVQRGRFTPYGSRAGFRHGSALSPHLRFVGIDGQRRRPEADRELASAMAECVNRRSPEWLLANADLVKVTVSLVRWSFAQTDELEKQVAEVTRNRTYPAL